MEDGIRIISIVVGFIASIFLFKPIFKNFSGFLKSISFIMTPNIISFFSGKSKEDMIAELKIYAWVIGSTIIGCFAYNILNDIFN